MTRIISTTNQTASKATIIRPVIFVKLDFSGGLVLVNSSPYSITFDGDTYLGVGDFGKISPVKEIGSIEATGITVGLSGVNPALISIALNESYQGRVATLFIGLLNEEHILVDTPMVLYKGRMDTMPIILGKESEISVTIRSRLSDLFRPIVRRFNNQDQQERYTGDKGLEFVEELSTKELRWKAA